MTAPWDATDSVVDIRSNEAAVNAAVREALKAQRAPKLRDPAPPAEPPQLPPVAVNPRRHDVVAWRHDGGLQSWRFMYREAAIEAAHALSWAIYWKWNVLDGRDLVARGDVVPPSDLTPQQIAAVIGE